jgi:septal ring-binding cell division protein DamX
MAITTKTIRGVAVTNLIIFGLIGCSNTPAPWTQEDESPWGSKHEAQEKQAASDEAVSDTSLNDPVLLADSDVEAIVMDAPDSAPAPQVIVPVVVEDAPVNMDIMAMLSTNYAVQVFAGNTVESVEKFKTDKGVEDLMTVKTDRSGSIVYVLVEIHPDRATADAAAAELEIKTGSKPWVRSLGGLQDIAVQ